MQKELENSSLTLASLVQHIDKNLCTGSYTTLLVAFASSQILKNNKNSFSVFFDDIRLAIF